MKVGPNSRVRELLTAEVSDGNNNVEFVLEAKGPSHLDRVTRSTKVVPRGFPFSCYGAGILKFVFPFPIDSITFFTLYNFV